MVNGVDLTSQPDPVTVGFKISENTGMTTVEFQATTVCQLLVISRQRNQDVAISPLALAIGPTRER